MSHTKGKLSLDKYGNIKTEGADDFRLNGATLSSSSLAVANTRRLVACWNACDGLPTKKLEDVRDWEKAGIETANTLRKERDELLAVLKKVDVICDESKSILAKYKEAE